METVEHLIVGAGPAGLRAAQVRDEAGREVLVVERRAEIGPKTCAGGLVPFEGAVLEVEYRGMHFPGGVHLVGDAARLPSALTAEGIYPALVSGEDAARRILDPHARAPRTGSWLRVKRRHDRLARWAHHAPVRSALFPALDALARVPTARRTLARWFLAA